MERNLKLAFWNTIFYSKFVLKIEFGRLFGPQTGSQGEIDWVCVQQIAPRDFVGQQKNSLVYYN